MRVKVDQSTSRAMNRRLILNLLRQRGSMSRVDLVGITGLSPAAVTFVVNGLLREGFVSEGQASRSRGSGRRPVPLRINYGGGLAIGFKLMAASIEGVLTDLSTSVLESRSFPLDDVTPRAMVETMVAASAELTTARSSGAARIMGIGVAVPGIIDKQNGICVRSNRFDWDDVPLAAMLAARVNVPVWLEDDTNAYALAQQLFGLGREIANFGALAVGVGISCALVIGGGLYRGANGGAGKLGHTVVDPNGPLCECGRHGCLQALYAEPVLVERWRRMRGLGQETGRSAMIAALDQGDPQAQAVLADAGETIGRALAGLVNVVDPEVVIMGGEAVHFGGALLDPMRRSLKRFSFRPPPQIVPDWQDNSWARGAAALVTQRFFDFEASPGQTREWEIDSTSEGDKGSSPASRNSAPPTPP